MVATYRGSADIDGLWKLNEITTDAVIDGVKRLIQDYDDIRSVMVQFRDEHDWIHTCKTLSNMYHAVSQFHNLDSETIREKYRLVYENTTRI
jgi:hypothetical protein